MKKNFKNLAEVKRHLQPGSKVIINKFMQGFREEREVVDNNTVGITTYSTQQINQEHFLRTGERIFGTEIELNWQKAKDTVIRGNMIYFLMNSDGYLDFKRGEVWLTMEVL